MVCPLNNVYGRRDGRAAWTDTLFKEIVILFNVENSIKRVNLFTLFFLLSYELFIVQFFANLKQFIYTIFFFLFQFSHKTNKNTFCSRRLLPSIMTSLWNISGNAPPRKRLDANGSSLEKRTTASPPPRSRKKRRTVRLNGIFPTDGERNTLIRIHGYGGGRRPRHGRRP